VAAARDRAAGLLLDDDPGALGLLMGERATLPEGARLREEPYGRTGVERALDGELHGRPGVRVVVRDARGRARDTLTEVAPADGRDVRLTIDADLQAAAERALDEAVVRHGDPRAGGAAVVLDLRTGDALVVASAPRFDPNVMGARFDEWRDDPRLPLLDRSVSAFAPGSTWKPISSFALTDPTVEGSVPLGWTTDCEGRLFRNVTSAFRCDGVHGTTDLPRALERSCNVFFFRAADKVGMDAMADWAERLGLGRRLLGLPGERAGHIPRTTSKGARLRSAAAAVSARWSSTIAALAARGMDPDAARAALRHLDRAVWWLECCAADRVPLPGDARNAFIGQGTVLATPVQIAYLAEVLATGGHAPAPRFDADAPVTVRDVDLPPATLAKVREGLRRVVLHGTGSDPRYGLSRLDVAGKTGTAERNKDQPKLAWFMGYYPASRPEISFAVLVDRTAGHGGDVCAPVCRSIIDAYEAVKRGDDPAAPRAPAAPAGRSR
jgi:penicillin-binding protein 2